MHNTVRCLVFIVAVLSAPLVHASVRTEARLPFQPMGGAEPHLPFVNITAYTLVPGDTITAVAQKFGLEADTLLSLNAIRSPRMVRAGVTLKVPNRNGVVIALDAPQTVASVAAQYQVFASLLLQANDLPEGTTELEGSVFVPGAKLDYESHRKFLGELFAWPTIGGRISSYFGRRNDPFTGEISSHSGVDIAVPWGTPVLAAGNGRVTYAGYNSILGNHIQVDQGDGYTVVYGHLSAILTRPGQFVRGGQKIGRVGSTGYSTGPHLHFGAYRWNRLLNPMTLFG